MLQSNQAVKNQASHPEQTTTRLATRHTLTGLLAAAGLLATQLTHAVFFTPGQFDVTPTGAASYTVPIAVPPGTAGMVPSLALSYNSQGGNGLLGVGWSLSGLSAITRCPKTLAQDNTKSGINYDANDKYCLDGQRLVAISGAYGANGTEYRTEREGFSKVVSYGSNGYGPTWFKVWTKSGQIIEFGNTTDSAIEAQGKTAIRVWAVNKIADTKGNYLTVSFSDYMQWEGGSFGRAMSHAVAGCAGASSGGGNCRSGALSAGFAEFAGPKLNFQSDTANLIAHSVLGGTASVLGGGKFENGAMNGAFGYLFNHLLHYNGKTARYYDDDGKLLAEYPATSGRDGVTDPTIRDRGPIPEGNYTLDPSAIKERSFLSRAASLIGARADWGKFLVPLQVNPGTNTFGRDSFYLHGGFIPGSAGCIDVGKYDSSLFPMLQNHSGPIKVKVNH